MSTVSEEFFFTSSLFFLTEINPSALFSFRYFFSVWRALIINDNIFDFDFRPQRKFSTVEKRITFLILFVKKLQSRHSSIISPEGFFVNKSLPLFCRKSTGVDFIHAIYALVQEFILPSSNPFSYFFLLLFLLEMGFKAFVFC